MSMTVEMWPVDRLRPYDKNPRLNDEAVDAVSRSIQEFGFQIGDLTGQFLAGDRSQQGQQRMQNAFHCGTVD